ncbi:hypothetical protein MHIMP23_19720 [Methylobacterium hispanicum]
MDVVAVLARIEERLKAEGLSADAASRAAGTPDAIRNLRRTVKNGDRKGVTMATLGKLAPVLKTTVGYLAEGEESRLLSEGISHARQAISIPVVGTLAAGVFREVVEHDDAEPEYIFDEPDPEFPNARLVAFTVEGDSLNELKPRPILSGDRLICVDFDDTGLPLIEGMVVVLQRTRDGGLTREWSAKQVEIHTGRTEYHPRSSNKNLKPIVVPDNPHADTGEQVEVLALVRRTSYALPKAPAPSRRK